MAQFRKKPVAIEAITFEELVGYGKAHAVSLQNGVPWSFDYKGHAITHENDDCYLIPTLEGTMKLSRGDMLITGVAGEIYPCKPDIFAATYDPAEPLPAPEGPRCPECTGPLVWLCVVCGQSNEGGPPPFEDDEPDAPERTEEQAVVEAAWTERVEHGEEYALVVEMGARGDYWWVLCPASATLITDVPKIEDDPTNPDDHEACSISPECDFFELHALAHAAIRRRAALVHSTPAPRGDA